MIAKQIEIRSNIKKYFDMAYEGDPIIVPRKANRNVVIISENEYNRLSQADRLMAYGHRMTDPQKTVHGKSEKRQNEDVRSFNFEKLKVISELQENWNGNGAPVFSKELIEKVGQILQALKIQPEIFPTALSTIQLEYDNARKDHLEIEIGEADTAEIFMVSYDGRESFEEIPVNAESINQFVEAFYG